MTIAGLPPGLNGVQAAPTPNRTSFAEVLKSKAAAPKPPSPPRAPAGAPTESALTPRGTAEQALQRVQTAQARMDRILKLAESGRSFTAAELLSLQTQVYRASQEIDLAGKVVEKATGGVKQVLQTQV